MRGRVLKMKRYMVCERTTELNISSTSICNYKEKEIMDIIDAKYSDHGDKTPRLVSVFDNLEAALECYEKKFQRLTYEGYPNFVRIDELYIVTDEWDEEFEEWEPCNEDDKYTICPELKDKTFIVYSRKNNIEITVQDYTGKTVHTFIFTADECKDSTSYENMETLIDKFHEQTDVLNLDRELEWDSTIREALSEWSKNEEE